MIKGKSIRFLKKLALSLLAFAAFSSCDGMYRYYSSNPGASLDSYGNVAKIVNVSYSRQPVIINGAYYIDSSDDFVITYLVDNPGKFPLWFTGLNLPYQIQYPPNNTITRSYSALELKNKDGSSLGVGSTITILAYAPNGRMVPQSDFRGPEIYCNSLPQAINNALGQMHSDAGASINERLVIALQLPSGREEMPQSNPSLPPIYRIVYNDWNKLVATDKRTGSAHEFAFDRYINLDSTTGPSQGTISDGIEFNGWTIHNSSNPPSPLDPTYSGGPTFTPSSAEGDVYYIVTDVDNLSSVVPFQIELTIVDDAGLTNPIEIPSHVSQLAAPTCNINVASVSNTLDQAYVEFIIHAPANASDATLHYAIADSSGNPVADTSGSVTEHVGDATFRLYPKINGDPETYTISQAYASKTGWMDSDDAAATFGGGGTISVTGVQLSAPTCNLTGGQTYPQETELVITSPEAADVGWIYNIGGGAFIAGSAPSPASIRLEEAGAYAIVFYAQKDYYEKSASVHMAFDISLTALYVASYGLDTNAGTRSSPFGTIQHAIDTFAAGSSPNSPDNSVYILDDMTSINGLTSMGSGYVNIVGCNGGEAGVPGTPVALGCAHDVTVIQLSGGTMSLRAVSITGISGTSNGAVYVAGGTFILKDKVTITGNKKADASAMNVNIGSGVITVDAAGLGGTKVGVTSAAVPALGSPVEITSGYGTSMSASDSPMLHFASDNASYGIGLNAAGTEAALVTGGGSIDIGDIASVSFAAAGSAGVYTVKATATPTSGSPLDITSEVTAWTLKLYYLNTYTGMTSATNTMDLSALGEGTYIMKISAVYGGKTYSGEVEIVISDGTAGMVLIPHGSFKRAASSGATAYNITLTKDFYMCDHEVTQKEWFDVIGVKQEDMYATDKGWGDNYPVYYVNWYAAIAYCNKRSVKEGLTPCYSVSGVTDWAALNFASIPTSSDPDWNSATCDFNASGYRLPTEAEWEYAALGSYKDNSHWTGCIDSNHPSANVFAGYDETNALGDYAWYSGNASSKTHEAKKKTENSYSLYDMSGNVWEWCWDWYGSGQYDTDGNVSDPSGASSGSYRVNRGGSWFSGAGLCSVAYRGNNSPYYRCDYIGLRVVRTAP